jgi:hypothetical protein
VGLSSWFRSNVTMTLTATDPDGPSDIAGTFFTIDGGSTQTYGGPFLVSGDGTHTVKFWSVDHFGAEETPHKTRVVKIDTTNPTLTFGAQSPAQNGFGWNNGTVNIGYSTADATSGVLSASPGSPLVFSSEGAGQTQTVTVMDKAGNSAMFTSAAVNIDLTNPVTTSSLSGTLGGGGWYLSDVGVTLSPTDNLSGVQTTHYTVDGGATQTGTTFTVTGDGIHTVQYWSVDKADNVEGTNTITIKIDTTPPTITGTASRTTLWPPNHKQLPVTIAGSITDLGSGVDLSTCKYHVVDEYGEDQPAGSITLAGDGSYSFTIQLTSDRLGQDKDGRTYTIIIEASDIAGNPASFSIVVTVPHDQGH